MTLEEVARIAGTSRSTVSRVINNDPKVSEEVRARVKRVISDTGYRPNASARNLAGKSTGVISLLVPRSPVETFNDPFYGPLLKGLGSACNERDYGLMLLVLDKPEPHIQRRLLNTHNTDGFILALSLINHNPYIPYLTERNIPFVSIGRHPYFTRINYVDLDNIGAAAEAVRHMTRLGLRRIATITGSLEVISGIDRRDGYLKALKEAGIEPDPNLIIEGGFTSQQSYEAMRQLLPLKPEGVFVASDTMAVGAYRAIHEAGLRVPDDISVVGFDDSEQASHMVPPLTTVRQPIAEMGAVAAEILLDIISDSAKQPVQRVLPSQLVARRSCGRPSNNRSEGRTEGDRVDAVITY